MLKGTALKAALKKAPLVVYKGVVTRFQYEEFRYGVMPKGSYDHGGRYNELGSRAIYVSPVRICALLEFTRGRQDDEPISAASMLSLFVDLRKVLDLTNPAVLKLLQTSKEELCAPMFRKTGQPTQQLGTAAQELGIDGIIAPSRVYEGNNLVIFPDTRVLPPYRVLVRVGRA